GRGRGVGRGDGAEITAPHFAAGRRRVPGAGKIGGVLGPGHRADRLVATADLGASAGEVDIAAAQLPADVDRGETERLQPHRVETNADLALDTADAIDACDPAYAL